MTAAPSALALLLAQRRSVLLELPGDEEAARERVRLVHIAQGAHLAVQGGARTRTAALGAGDAVTVSVPVSGSVWRFTTTVLGRGAAAGDALLLDWPTGAERIVGRRYPRIVTTLPARVQAAGAERAFCTYTLDVSGTGLQLSLPAALPPGTAVVVSLECPCGLVALTAEVRWRRSAAAHPDDPMFRVGVAIQAIDNLARHRLLEYLRGNDHLRIEAHG